MKKAIAFLVIFIIFAVAGFFGYKYFFANKTASLTQQTIKSENISSFVENKTDNYKITFSYPKFSGIKNLSAQEKINNDIKKYITDLVEADKKEAKDACNFSDLPGGAPNWQCDYEIGSDGFNITSEKILSVKMTYYWFTGGAHGGTNTEFLNYNLASGERIDWKNVFKKDSDFLKVIANYSKTDLEKQLLQGPDNLSDSEWIKTGTDASNKDNYKTNVGFKNDPADANGRGLLVIFGQYQVAPYSSGMPEVVIPYSQLKDVLDPAGLLGDFAK